MTSHRNLIWFRREEETTTQSAFMAAWISR